MFRQCLDLPDLLCAAAPVSQRGRSPSRHMVPVTLQLAHRAFVLFVAFDREAAEDRWDNLAVMRDRAASLPRRLLQH